MNVLVRNINGTVMYKPRGYNSWKDFWETKKGEPFRLCSNCQCYHNIAEVGAHVQKASYGASNEWYIVPLCKPCNNKSETFYVDSYYLVRVSD